MKRNGYMQANDNSSITLMIDVQNIWEVSESEIHLAVFR